MRAARKKERDVRADGVAANYAGLWPYAVGREGQLGTPVVGR
jgi:hypothetical protein